VTRVELVAVHPQRQVEAHTIEGNGDPTDRSNDG
jgi:hypothetical protein